MGFWSWLDAIVKDVLGSGKVRKDHVKAFAALMPRLPAALAKMTGSDEYYAFRGRRFSVRLSTFAVVESQQTRIPKMTTALMFSGFSHELERYKKQPTATYAEFDCALKGLMLGDPELRVLAARSRRSSWATKPSTSSGRGFSRS
jgi:hypothetical protein